MLVGCALAIFTAFRTQEQHEVLARLKEKLLNPSSYACPAASMIFAVCTIGRNRAATVLPMVWRLSRRIGQ